MVHFTSINTIRLPGVRSFVERSKIFRKSIRDPEPNCAQLVATATEVLKSGRLRPGEGFPTPEELSNSTGARLSASLDAVTDLLQSGLIQQHTSGQLVVANPPRA